MSEYNPPGGGGGDVSKADLAQNIQFHGVIWASGITYYGKRTDTNVVIASGTDPSHVMFETIRQIQIPSQTKRNVLIKKGDYFFSSGVIFSGTNLTVLGEGPEKTILFADTIGGKISGLIKLGGHSQTIGDMEISLVSGVYSAIEANGRVHLNIHDLMLFAVGETVSGTHGIKFNNCSSSFIKNIELYSANEGIHLLSSESNHIENIYSESFGTLVQLIGSSTRNNTVEFVDATATSYLSGIVGLISGAQQNVVRSIHSNFELPCVYIDTVSGTRRNKISDITNTDISGIQILNNSPGKNFIGAYYPEVGIGDTARFTIWVSGGIYQALRNNDGEIIASGTNAANVFQTVFNTIGTSFDGMVHVKAEDYHFTSGIRMGGGTTLYGDPGGGTVFDWNSASGAISGAIRISGVRIALRDVDLFGLSGVNPVIYTADTTCEIDNVDVDSNDGTPYSGLIGIHIAGGRGDITLRNVSVFSHDTGIYVASGSNGIFTASLGTIIEDARVGNCNCGILLDASSQNIITNVIGDGTQTSGTVRLINMSNDNVIDNIIGGP